MEFEIESQQVPGQGQDIEELRKQAFFAIMKLPEKERAHVVSKIMEKYGAKYGRK